MKIVLINPPLLSPRRTNFPPIGLGYISAVLKKSGYHVKCIDACNMTWKFLEKRISEENPNIVGVTCWTFSRAQAAKVCGLVKRIFPEAKLIVGGQHATFLPEQTLEATNADFVVLGEAEEIIISLISNIANNDDPKKVNGIAYRNGKSLVITQRHPMVSDLDEIPFPDYADFNLENYRGLPEYGRKAAGIITSRGCPFNCHYCSSKEFWNNKWRYRSTKNVLSEIEFIYNTLGVRALMFFDDNFTVKKDRIIEICRGIIDRKFDLVWSCIGSVGVVDEEILKWMKKAGCFQIQYGVESGSPKILKNINKNQTLKQIKNAFLWTRKLGMDPYAYLVVGAPGENKETIDDTIHLMGKIAPNQDPAGGIGILWILPGTEIYQDAISRGIVSDNSWNEKDDEYFYYTGEHSLAELEQLRMRLKKGLARNAGIFSLLNFILRNSIKKAKLFQKLNIPFKDLCFLFKRFLTTRIYPLRRSGPT